MLQPFSHAVLAFEHASPPPTTSVGSPLEHPRRKWFTRSPEPTPAFVTSQRPDVPAEGPASAKQNRPPPLQLQHGLREMEERYAEALPLMPLGEKTSGSDARFAAVTCVHTSELDSRGGPNQFPQHALQLRPRHRLAIRRAVENAVNQYQNGLGLVFRDAKNP
eukprot:3936645-Rhodomonas_salina.2